MSLDKNEKFKAYLDDSSDIRPDRLDLRDRIYRPPLKSIPERLPRRFRNSVLAYIEAGMVLDQESDGSCTGFALAAVVNSLFWRKTMASLKREKRFSWNWDKEKRNVFPELADKKTLKQWKSHIAELTKSSPKVSARMLYHLARFYDEWPGEQNSGSSLRGAMKAWHRHGACSETLWKSQASFTPPLNGWAVDASTRPLGVYYRIDRNSVVDMQAAIQEVESIVVSARVHEGWKKLFRKNHDAERAFHELSHEKIQKIEWSPQTQPLGMHAFALVGYNEFGFIVQNSWGKKWGTGGFAVITYSDWTKNGVDAWAAVLGAPTRKPSPPLRVYIESTRPGNRVSPSDNSGQIEIGASFWKQQKANATRLPVTSKAIKQKPDTGVWSLQNAFEHCVTLGSNGRAINRLVEKRNADAAVLHVACKLPDHQFTDWHGDDKEAKVKIAIIALSGLLPDTEEVTRIRLLGRQYEKNNVYPIFIGQQNGFLTPFLNLAGKQIMKIIPQDSTSIEFLLGERDERAIEAWDRTIEAVFASEGGKPMWTQFKQDALLSAEETPMLQRSIDGKSQQKVKEDSGLHLLASYICKLKKEWPNLEIHLVGHSGGAIALAHLLKPLNKGLHDLLGRKNKLQIKSCSLYAPACSVKLANDTFRKYIKYVKLINPKKFYVYTLSEELENEDCFGPYHKSFLRLVSNALEDWSGTPLLGLAHATNQGFWHPATSAITAEWRTMWCEIALEIPKIKPRTDQQVEIAPGTFVLQSHESFPDNVKIANETLRIITGIPKGEKLVAPITNLDWRNFDQQSN